ncbi:hypothetical protein AVP43_03218 [Geobacillus stearothermophilus]|nr:hypothetical protein AVP43_03218 [Geobacillus stearothermophilus]
MMSLQQLMVLAGCVLGALIAMEKDSSRIPFFDGILDRFDHQF